MMILVLALACIQSDWNIDIPDDTIGGVLPGGDADITLQWAGDGQRPDTWAGEETPSACQGDKVITVVEDLDLFQANGCESMTGDLVISNVAGLEHLHLPMLRSVDGSVYIAGNPDLQSVDMPDLLVVTRNLQLQGQSVGQTNPLLHSVWMPSLQAVGQDLNTGMMTALHTLDLGDLWRVGGDAVIDLADQPGALELGALEQVVGDMYLWGPGLQAVDLDALRSAQDLDLSIGGARIALPQLQQAADLFVSTPEFSAASLVQADTLVSAEGLRLVNLNLPLLTTVHGDIDLVLKMAQASLPSLQTVGGDLAVSAWYATDALGNPTTVVLDSLGMRQLAHVAGDLRITGRMAGDGLVQLESLLSVGGDATFEGVGTLVVERLRETAGSLTVTKATAAELSFPTLRQTNGDFVLAGNTDLLTVDADRLIQVDGDIVVQDNPHMSTCAAWDLVFQVDEAKGLGGSVVIDGNLDDGCAVDLDPGGG